VPGRILSAAILLLACACSRAPEPHARAEGKAAAPAPSASPGALHLAAGEEARNRGENARASKEFQEARDLFERAQDWEGYVRATNFIAAMATRRGDYKAALEHLNVALAAAQTRLPPGHPELARSYYEIGAVYVSTGLIAEGLEQLEKALALRRSTGAGKTSAAAEVLLRIGVALSAQGDDDRALARFAEAEAIERELPARARLGDVLIGKGSAVWGQGRFDEAIAAFEEAVSILEREGPGRTASLASAYVNLGNVYWSKSDYDEALAYYDKALPLQIASRGEAHQYVGLIHFNRATLFYMKGDYPAAIASAEKALAIYRRALGERHSSIVNTYNVLGVAYTRQGEPDRGLAILHKALDLQLSLRDEMDRDAAVTYSSLGAAYRAKRNFAAADRTLRQALAIDISLRGERHPDVAEDFVNLGDLYLEKGDAAAALGFYGKAIAANTAQRVEHDPDLDPPLENAFSDTFLLAALKGAARARAQRGTQTGSVRDVEASARAYAHAARLIERMRAGYRAEGSKLSLLASATEIYDEAIGMELELHRLTGDTRHVENAFRYAEHSKAGVLRDALNESEARAFARLPAALLDEERRLRDDLAAADRTITEASLEASADQARLQGARERQFALKRSYGALQQRLEREFPDYYDLKYRFETVPSSEVRQQALDERSVLVEYFMGRERLYVFSITRQDLQVASVAGRSSLDTMVPALRRAITDRDAASYERTAHGLYQLLLAPVESRTSGKDLLIVPDGPLSLVPFEALLKRRDSAPHDSRGMPPYVLRDHAVSYAYSASVLLQGLRRNMEPPQDEFVGFAPGFAGTADRGQSPRPLPASRQEVTDVRAMFDDRAGLFGGWLSGRSRTYVDGDATASRLKTAGLERYRFVHFATHAIVDERQPALSRLLFSAENGSGAPGVLTLGDVYNLRLNADLVVLSACDTGGGEIARGEGIIGLTRGFLYAGAKSLLVSLWPVSDEATARLTSDFYSELLKGRSKAHALREAKLRSVMRNPEHAKPFYWSSVVLIGDRR
jgi:CHAT domain-containing protein